MLKKSSDGSFTGNGAIEVVPTASAPKSPRSQPHQCANKIDSVFASLLAGSESSMRCVQEGVVNISRDDLTSDCKRRRQMPNERSIHDWDIERCNSRRVKENRNGSPYSEGFECQSQCHYDLDNHAYHDSMTPQSAPCDLVGRSHTSKMYSGPSHPVKIPHRRSEAHSSSLQLSQPNQPTCLSAVATKPPAGKMAAGDLLAMLRAKGILPSTSSQK